MSTIHAQRLTRAAFAPFGDVISVGQVAGKEANQGTAVRYDYTAQLANGRPDAKANLVVFRCDGQTLPFQAKVIEHHPHSSQMFLPLDCSRYLVCVAPTAADGGPDVSRLQAFIAKGGEGINYHVGTWHHPMVALDKPAEFAVLVWENGSPEDTVLRRLEHAITVLEP